MPGKSPPQKSSERKSPKQKLVDQVVDHFVVDGLGDMSLRKIAASIGTSHRMLLYHFGSKNGLLVEVVRAVEARAQDQLAEIGSRTAPEPEPVPGGREAPATEPGGAEPAGAGAGDTDRVIRDMWEFLADPAQADFERLFFALYGRALQGDAQVRPLLGEAIESWLDANVALAEVRGIPPDESRMHARLGLAVVRGLLLDLLATGDRAGVDAALEIFASRYAGRWWEPVGASAHAS